MTELPWSDYRRGLSDSRRRRETLHIEMDDRPISIGGYAASLLVAQNPLATIMLQQNMIGG